MLFKKKQPMDREELELKIFKTKIELRRIMEKYEVMLQRELRIARAEQSAGAKRSSNYEKLRTIAGLLATTKKAYQEMDNISTADELSRTTADLTAALQNLNQIAGSAQKPEAGGIRRGIKQMQAVDARLERQHKAQNRALTRANSKTENYEAELEAILSGESVQDVCQDQMPLTDEALDVQMDAINNDVLSWLDEI